MVHGVRVELCSAKFPSTPTLRKESFRRCNWGLPEVVPADRPTVHEPKDVQPNGLHFSFSTTAEAQTEGTKKREHFEKVETKMKNLADKSGGRLKLHFKKVPQIWAAMPRVRIRRIERVVLKHQHDNKRCASSDHDHGPLAGASLVGRNVSVREVGVLPGRAGV